MSKVNRADTLTLTLRGGRIHVVSNGDQVGYVNLMTGTAVCLPIEDFVHAIRLAKVERTRKEFKNAQS